MPIQARGAPKKPTPFGFTLLELMLVVTIIAALAAIAVPKFADFLRKSREARTKGNLGSIRSALSIYYADNAIFPGSLPSLTIAGKYLGEIPAANPAFYHAESSAESNCSPTDPAGWCYLGNASGVNEGKVYVGCDHTDTKGSAWSAY